MWCLGTWFGGGLGSVRAMAGLDDLKGLFQPKWFCHSMNLLIIRITRAILTLNVKKQPHLLLQAEVNEMPRQHPGKMWLSTDSCISVHCSLYLLQCLKVCWSWLWLYVWVGKVLNKSAYILYSARSRPTIPSTDRGVYTILTSLKILRVT